MFGYDIECVRNANHRLIHAYCVGFIGDEKAYIDIRGITTDKNLFFKEFDNELFYYAPQDTVLVEDDEGYEVEAEIEVWHSKDELFEGDYEGWTDPEISTFIKDYVDYYSAERCISVLKQSDSPEKEVLPGLSEMIGAAEQCSQRQESLFKDSGREIAAR